MMNVERMNLDPLTQAFLACVREAESQKRLFCKPAGTGKRARRQMTSQGGGRALRPQKSRGKGGRRVN